MADWVSVIIEPLAPERLGELSAFINACWREAYAGILPDEFLAGLTTEGRLPYLESKLSRGLVGALALDGAIAGVVMYGPSHFASLPAAGEVNLLYVRPDLIGQGLGHRLLVLAETVLAEQGYPSFVLDVFSANTQAIDFYRRHGYAKVGDNIDQIEGATYPLDIMAKPVA